MATEIERQEWIIASIGEMADTVSALHDTQLELIKWLRQPASSDLPDLLRVVIAKLDTLTEMMVKVGSMVSAGRG